MNLHDHESERSLIGAALINPNVVVKIGHLEPGDFHNAHYALIWQAMQGLQGLDFDYTQVRARVEDLGGSDGAARALLEAEEMALSAANAGVYADTVRERAQRRRYIAAAERIAELAKSADVDAATVAAEAEAAIFAAASRTIAFDPKPIGNALTEYFADVQAAKDGAGMLGLPLGLAKLDDVTKGLRGGQVVVIAGRPGLGKSTLADQFAGFVGEFHKVRTLIFNLEMAAKELAPRAISRRLKLTEPECLDSIRSDFGMANYSAAITKISSLPIDIDDRAEITVQELRTQARRHKLRHPDLGLIVIDYLQLVRGGLKKTESREREVAHISRSVKVLAKELDLPVLLLSQLSRDAEKDGRRPRLSDLRESGSIEQDADMVLLIDHDGDPTPDAAGDGVPAEIIVAKNRKGPTGTVPVWFRRKWSRFEPRAEDAVPMPTDADAPRPRRFADRHQRGGRRAG